MIYFEMILIYNEVVMSDPILDTVEKVISITVNLLLTILCRPDDNPQEVVSSFTVYSHPTTNNFAAKRNNSEIIETIGHFRVPKTLIFKMRLSAQLFL